MVLTYLLIIKDIYYNFHALYYTIFLQFFQYPMKADYYYFHRFFLNEIFYQL